MWRAAALMLGLGLAGATLSACQMNLPFRGAQTGGGEVSAQAGVTAKPGTIAGGTVTARPIAATPIAAKPATVSVAKGGAAIPAGTIKGASQPAPPPQPDKATSQESNETEPAEAAPVAEPAPPKSAPQLACEATGGIWSEAGKAGVKTCVQRTRDAGKSCKREGDCEGFCLARSRSCAPVTPLFGCNDILQADGGQVTLCID